jgi:hypothetical protein
VFQTSLYNEHNSKTIGFFVWYPHIQQSGTPKCKNSRCPIPEWEVGKRIIKEAKYHSTQLDSGGVGSKIQAERGGG